jgi:hypothetical protein
MGLGLIDIDKDAATADTVVSSQRKACIANES